MRTNKSIFVLFKFYILKVRVLHLINTQPIECPYQLPKCFMLRLQKLAFEAFIQQKSHGLAKLKGLRSATRMNEAVKILFKIFFIKI